MTKKFAMVGAAGFVAPRHMKAIKETGNELVAAYDPNDSVGILDSYFINCEFFNDYDHFFKFLRHNRVDYLVICTPNYTHYRYIKLAEFLYIDVIVEKPALIDSLDFCFMNYSKITVNCILQMRLHTEAQNLRDHLILNPSKEIVIDISYLVPRGDWYNKSWKTDPEKSGGVLFNIGIHLFDLLISIMGEPIDVFVDDVGETHSFGTLVFDFNNKEVEVNYKLGITQDIKERIFKVAGLDFDFTNGFEDLHLLSYKKILNGEGFTLKDCRKAIELVETMNNK